MFGEIVTGRVLMGLGSFYGTCVGMCVGVEHSSY